MLGILGIGSCFLSGDVDLSFAEGYSVLLCEKNDSEILKNLNLLTEEVCVLLDCTSVSPETLKGHLDQIREFSPGIHIIAVFMNEKSRSVNEYINVGCDYCISYPDEADQLHSLVERIASRSIALDEHKKISSIYRAEFLLENKYPAINHFITDDYPAYKAGNLYRAVVVRILPPYRTRFNRQNDDLILLKGLEILHQDFDRFENCVILQRDQDFVVLMYGNEQEIEHCSSVFSDFLNHMDGVSYSYFKISTWIALGDVVSNVDEINQSYLDARSLLNERLFMNTNFGILDKNQISTIQPLLNHLSAAHKQSLINAIETYDENDIKRVFAQLRSDLEASSDVSGSTLFSIYKELVSIFFLEYHSISNVELDERLSYSYIIREFDYFWTLDDMFLFLEPLFISNVNSWKEQGQSKEHLKIRLAKKYINDFYGMPISLEEVGNYVGLNASYFSDYFKRETGKTFSNYLAEVRIKYAKQLLANDKLKLEDVAESVGYNDKKYFSKVFKRETGLTPGEYKRMSLY